MFRCAIYTNKNSFISTKKQRLACKAFAAKNGFTVLRKRYDDFCDGSIPALKRPAMQKLFDDIETCEVEYVLFYTLDCMARSVEELSKILHLFEERNVLFDYIRPVKFSVENGELCGFSTKIADFMGVEKKHVKAKC